MLNGLLGKCGESPSSGAPALEPAFMVEGFLAKDRFTVSLNLRVAGFRV